MTILRPEALFDGTTIRTGLAVALDGGRIAAITPDDTPSDLPGLLAPGYVDLQVNGGGGVLLNNDPTPEGMRVLARAHRARGTAALLPTLITDAPEAMDRAADAIRRVIGQDGIVGLHLEGPHLAPTRRGTHRAAFLRPLDDRTINLALALARDGIPLMLTLAPEQAPTGAIRTLTDAGVIVSVGHTAATPDQIAQAVAEGAQAATHLYNAMDPMTSRTPGALGAIMDSDLTAGIIADGHHVDPLMIRLAFRARPGRMMVVSDAMATVGGPDHFTLYGETIHMDQGRLINAEGALAGVHIHMAGSVAFLTGPARLPLDTALAAATSIPARLMRLPGHGTLAPGAPADLILIDRRGGVIRRFF